MTRHAPPASGCRPWARALARGLGAGLFVLFLNGGAPATARPEAIITLRSEPFVRGEAIQLGAIADIESGDPVLAAELHSLVVGRAAPPGEVREVDFTYVRIRLRQTGLADDQFRLMPPPGIDERGSVPVRTLAQIVSAAALRAAVDQAVRAALAASLLRADEAANGLMAPNVEIEFGALPDLQIPVGALALRVAPFQRRPSGSVIASVQVVVDGQAVRTLPVRASVQVLQPVLVLKERVSRHTPLAPELVAFERRDERSVPAGALRSADQMNGMRTARYLRAGSILSESVVEPVPDAAAGDVVRILAQVGVVTVVAEGVLLADGRIGDRVPAENGGSGEVVWGRLAEGKVVRVGG